MHYTSHSKQGDKLDNAVKFACGYQSPKQPKMQCSVALAKLVLLDFINDIDYAIQSINLNDTVLQCEVLEYYEDFSIAYLAESENCFRLLYESNIISRCGLSACNIPERLAMNALQTCLLQLLNKGLQQ